MRRLYQVDPNKRPPKHILDWCRALMDRAADGAFWGIPRSGTTFRIDKTNKKLVCLSQGPDEDPSDFEATKQVFKHIGWVVVREEPELETPQES